MPHVGSSHASGTGQRTQCSHPKNVLFWGGRKASEDPGSAGQGDCPGFDGNTGNAGRLGMKLGSREFDVTLCDVMLLVLVLGCGFINQTDNS
ncbi:hypothetical protein HZ326_8079 [Fusarium oxysporum f. sp. albedinis]|nr:hypothetical protein HZ326_8079 [Fusarium oxysporum f. sp. albedinis]